MKRADELIYVWPPTMQVLELQNEMEKSRESAVAKERQLAAAVAALAQNPALPYAAASSPLPTANNSGALPPNDASSPFAMPNGGASPGGPAPSQAANALQTMMNRAQTAAPGYAKVMMENLMGMGLSGASNSGGVAGTPPPRPYGLAGRNGEEEYR